MNHILFCYLPLTFLECMLVESHIRLLGFRVHLLSPCGFFLHRSFCGLEDWAHSVNDFFKLNFSQPTVLNHVVIASGRCLNVEMIVAEGLNISGGILVQLVIGHFKFQSSVFLEGVFCLFLCLSFKRCRAFLGSFSGSTRISGGREGKQIETPIGFNNLSKTTLKCPPFFSVWLFLEHSTQSIKCIQKNDVSHLQ